LYLIICSLQNIHPRELFKVREELATAEGEEHLNRVKEPLASGWYFEKFSSGAYLVR
jgi:hypothetical protein